MAPDSIARGRFGRRKGHPLRGRQAALTKSLLPRLLIDPSGAPCSSLAALFPDPVRRVRLEIGFGGGEHLVHRARAEPDIGHIGCEPFINGMGKALAGIDEHGLSNIRLFDDDILQLLPWLPEGGLDRIYLLYPDPWPKRRHWKRRIVSKVNLSHLARVLADGGELRFASDIASYVNWALRHAEYATEFHWTACRADDWRLPWPDWPGTRYEAKAIEAGRVPTYLTFRRAAR